MIAICVGHSRPGDKGAVSVGGITEHAFNSKLARQVLSKLEDHDIECQIIDAYQGLTYGTAMRWLGRKLKTLGAQGAVELHFNSEAPSANGHEWRYWHESVGGRYLAQALDGKMASACPTHKRRGLVPTREKMNGAGFLFHTPCPAAIAEPFFGSNAKEWAWAINNQNVIANVIADGIAAWNAGRSARA